MVQRKWPVLLMKAPMARVRVVEGSGGGVMG